MIWCFFYQIGLFFKAGLDPPGLKPMRIWHEWLGGFSPFGVMAVIEEEEGVWMSPMFHLEPMNFNLIRIAMRVETTILIQMIWTQTLIKVKTMILNSKMNLRLIKIPRHFIFLVIHAWKSQLMKQVWSHSSHLSYLSFDYFFFCFFQSFLLDSLLNYLDVCCQQEVDPLKRSPGQLQPTPIKS